MTRAYIAKDEYKRNLLVDMKCGLFKNVVMSTRFYLKPFIICAIGL